MIVTSKGARWHLIGTIGIVFLVAIIGAVFFMWHTVNFSGDIAAQIESGPQLKLPEFNSEFLLDTPDDSPSCDERGTFLICVCDVVKQIDGLCSLQTKGETERDASVFYESPVLGGLTKGEFLVFPSNAWRCKWERQSIFKHFVRNQNLCGDIDALESACKDAASTRLECRLSMEEANALDIDFRSCWEKERELCKGELHETDGYEIERSSVLIGGAI